MPKKPKPKIEDITRKFGERHMEKAEVEKEMAKLRKQFFDLIEIPQDKLARQTIYVEGDPDQYVATLYPKWRIVKKEVTHIDDESEWRVIIEEDPEKKTYVYINPKDHKVYTRTVAESAPGVDLERLKEDNLLLYESITFKPDPPRELKPLDQLTEDQKDILKRYLTPAKLVHRMEAPRKAKPEELEGLE